MPVERKKYLITTKRLNWLGGKRMAYKGEIVDDLPLDSIRWLKEQGLIEEVKDEPPAVDDGGGELDGDSE